MKHHLQHSLLLLFSLLCFHRSDAQLGGVMTIDNSQPSSATNFSTFKEAADSLNSQGVAFGGVTFQVAAGQTFMEAPISLYNIGSANAPVTFEKAGAGANPVIMPFFPGTRTLVSGPYSDGDFMIRIAGGSHITFDGLSISANPFFSTVSPDTTLEYGFYLTRMLVGGTHYAPRDITIRNCVINMKSNPGTTREGTCAIFSNIIDTNGFAGYTNIEGRSERLSFVANTIDESYNGIVVSGNYIPLRQLKDVNNIIDSNTITTYGGSIQGHGILVMDNDSVLIKRNMIRSTTFMTGGSNGITYEQGSQIVCWIDSNDISMISPSAPANVMGIFANTGTMAEVWMTNNFIHNSTVSGNFTGIASNIFAERTWITGNRFSSIVNIATVPSATTLISSGARKAEVSGNMISDVTIPMMGNTGTAYGIFNDESDSANIHHNSVSNFFCLDNSARIRGISSSALYANIYNNYVYDLKAINSADQNAIEGIHITMGDHRIYHNTVNLNATSSGSSFGTSALFAETAATVEMSNNILVNKSVAGSMGGYTAAYRRSGASLTSHAAASNNNCVFAGSGSNHALFFDGTNADSTIAQYKARFINGAETASFSELPPFTNDTATPFDLMMQTTVPTLCESGGKPIAMVSTDYFGTARNTTTPDVGAEEGSFTVMPVSLMKLSAAGVKKDAVIKWASASELNSNRFEVERSLNGKTWELTGKVKAAGNSSSIRQYAYTDVNAMNLAPVIYYRLKMIDHDGSFEYSAVVSVSAGKEEKISALLVPNPFNGDAFIRLNSDRAEEVRVTITDLAGKQLVLFTQQLAAGDNVLQIEKASAFETGIYLVLIETGNEKQVLKLIKQ